MLFSYRYAITRGISPNFERAEKQLAPTEAVDLALAKRQHDTYVEVLRSVIPNVIELPPLTDFPDCCFVEDPAVVIEDKAFINRLGAPSRRGEEPSIAECLEDLGLKVFPLDAPALSDGGDCLYTGRHLFLGLSHRTNREALEAIKSLPLGCEVVGVSVPEGLHLKSFVSQFDEEVILASACEAGLMIAAQLEAYGYRTVRIPEQAVCANVLRIGNHIVMQGGFPESAATIQSLCTEYRLDSQVLKMSEFIKSDGALTCCSILIP